MYEQFEKNCSFYLLIKLFNGFIEHINIQIREFYIRSFIYRKKNIFLNKSFPIWWFIFGMEFVKK